MFADAIARRLVAARPSLGFGEEQICQNALDPGPHRPTPKRDRLLELHEQGLSRSQIAERLGVTVSSVNNAIRLAKQRKSELQRKRQGS